AVQHVAFMAVLNAQHLLAVIVVAPAFAPELRRLDRRHQHLDGTGAVLLLAHDATDLPQNPQAERQEGIDAGSFLPDHPRPQHQAMGDDFGLLWSFAQDWQEISRQPHVGFCEIGKSRRPRPGRAWEEAYFAGPD